MYQWFQKNEKDALPLPLRAGASLRKKGQRFDSNTY